MAAPDDFHPVFATAECHLRQLAQIGVESVKVLLQSGKELPGAAWEADGNIEGLDGRSILTSIADQ
jgi:hypothetical protein